MKLVLCLIIVILSAYIGRLLSRRMSLRLEFFRDYHSAMTALSDKVVGLGLELYMALSASHCENIDPLFRMCARLLRQSPQIRLNVIWRQSFEQRRDMFASLSKTDVLVVMEGGDALESLCANPSEKQSAIYLKRLAAHIAALEQEKNKKCKLYNTAGLLAGLMIALLVI
jgi:stage III sporulation protein AB